jgi:hypothetical protein
VNVIADNSAPLRSESPLAYAGHYLRLASSLPFWPEGVFRSSHRYSGPDNGEISGTKRVLPDAGVQAARRMSTAKVETHLALAHNGIRLLGER